MPTQTITTNHYWEVPRVWEDKKVVVMATGPSLTTEQVQEVEDSDAAVVVVNDSWQLAPWADVLYACDMKWWKWHHEEARKSFEGLRVTNDNTKQIFQSFPELSVLHGKHAPGFSRESSTIHYGRNSGYQAVNLALLTGTKTVILLGFDYNYNHRNGAAHWFGDHPDKVRTGEAGFKRWIKEWETTVDDVKQFGARIINCSPGTSLTLYETMELTDALAIT